MADTETIIDRRYRVISQVGSGGMADVFLAQDNQLGRRVALKVLHRRFAEDAAFVERFRREASSAAGLSHPNVVAVFDRGEWDGTYYIAMEYLPGRSLKALVLEEGPLDPERAIDLVIQILRAARFAHQRGIIHRDLKPHNVIVGEDGRARVTDFGIARAGASDMTETGSIMGTAQYLSPEQAQGHAVSGASDLYAVGIVLYELLTGALPFDGDTAVTIALKQVSEAPQAPSAINPTVTPALDGVVLCALAKDPSQRFSDADSFIAALQDARRSLHGDNGATTHFAPVGVPPDLHAAAPPPGLAGLVVPAAEEVVSEPSRRGRRGWLIALGLIAVAGAAVALVLLLSPARARVAVPGLTRCASQATVTTALRRAGLSPRSVGAQTAACPSGLVVALSPPAGSRVARGAVVTVTVSTGPGSAPLPNVTGQSSAKALSVLRAAGFAPVARTLSSSLVAPRRVIKTDPLPGIELQRGSGVTVFVSGGPALATVPDLTGRSQVDATAALLAAGLHLGSVSQQQRDGQTPGTVLSQSPAAGVALVQGAAVDITVARAPDTVAVPDVVGQASDQAAAALGRAGFSVRDSTRPVGAAKNGRVLSEQPGAGQRAPRGATVTIVVGAYTAPGGGSTTTPPATTTPNPGTPPPASPHP